MTTRSLIALGGNLGDVAATFRSALARLDDVPEIRVLQVASNHGTRPMGANAGDEFLNSAAEFETTLGADELLAQLHEVEAAEGRVRTVHWGPRTLDLDLLLHGDTIVDTPDLRVPHPASWYRRFVLDPLVEIAPDVVHPVQQATIRELHGRLLQRPLPLSLRGGTPDLRTSITDALGLRFPAELTVTRDDTSSAAIVLQLEGSNDDKTAPSVVDVSAYEDPTAAVVDIVTAALG